MSDSECKIAVIGWAGQFPGAADIETFIDKTFAGEELIRYLSKEDLAQQGLSIEGDTPPEGFVPAYGAIDEVYHFDADFFAVRPGEAAVMDPQQRLLLQLAYQALCNGGYGVDSDLSNCGVFVGTSTSQYWFKQIYQAGQTQASPDFLAMLLGNGQDFAAPNISYRLNLGGPSINVNTACSTSLVAVHQACAALLNYECDMALSGGANISIHQETGYMTTAGSIESIDGHCRPFDQGANGTVPGNGGAVLLLKRLDDALEDNDPIHGVILGSAINNDGGDKVGFSAPGVNGQSTVIRAAQMMADVQCDDIGYIEAHGTGTHLGDPIEIKALSEAFETAQDRDFCALSSVKASIGHLNAAAGVAGLIRALATVGRAELPATANFSQLNPAIKLDDSPFYISQRRQPWPESAKMRRAGISSFGIGGTNVHMVVEQPPAADSHNESIAATANNIGYVLPFSAKNATALRHTISAIAAYVEANEALDLAALSHTLQQRRDVFACRDALVFADREALLAALNALLQSPGKTAAVATELKVGLVFSGQGSQLVGMYRELYQHHTPFRQLIDQGAKHIEAALGLDIRQLIYPQPGQANLDGAAALLQQTRYTQPALFMVQYALYHSLADLGVSPVCMAGHSLGEYVAACIAEVMSFETALDLVVARGQAMYQAPGGSMLVVFGEYHQIKPLLLADIAVAAINSSTNVTISGSDEDIAAQQQILIDQGMAVKALDTSHAYHSQLMLGAVENFAKAFVGVKLNPPTLAFISNVSGQAITDAEACDPQYWLDHMMSPVLFSQSVDALTSRCDVLVDMGPQAVLVNMLRQNQANAMAISPKGQQSVNCRLSNLLAGAWTLGCQLQWADYYQLTETCLHLPAYQYNKQQFILPELPAAEPAAPEPAPITSAATITDWVYEPCWQTPQEAAAVAAEKAPGQYSSLILLDSIEPSAALTAEFDRVRAIDDFTPEAQEQSQHMISLLSDANSHRNPYDLWLAIKQLISGIATELKQASQITLNLMAINSPGSKTPPSVTMAAAALNAYAQEIANLNTRVFIITEQQQIAPLLKQSLVSDKHFVMRVTADGAEQLSYQKVADNSQTAVPRLRLNGRYMIFGGMGRVGRHLSDYLTERYEADVTVVSKNPVLVEHDAQVTDIYQLLRQDFTRAKLEPQLATAPQIALKATADHLLCQLAAACVTRYMIEAGLRLSAGERHPLRQIKQTLAPDDPQLAAIVDAMLEALIRNDSVKLENTELVALVDLQQTPDIDTLLEKIKAEYVDFYGDAIRMAQVTAEFSAIFQGHKSGLEAIYSNRFDEDLLDNSSKTGIAMLSLDNRVAELVNFLRQQQRTSRPLKVLEIGGGSGSLTQQLIPQFDPTEIEYVYTDVSKQFVDNARREFAERQLTGFEARYLDITQDPFEQGFAYQEFDVIVGFNVIHIAPNINQAITALAALLKSDGAFAFIEDVQWKPANELVWGLTKEWWWYKDGGDGRALTPLLNVSQWQALLAEIGFADQQVILGDESFDDQALIIGQGISAPLYQRSFSLSDYLRHRTRSATTETHPSAEQQRSYLVMDITDAAHWAKLNQLMATTVQRYDGIVYSVTSFDSAIALHSELSPYDAKKEFTVKVDCLSHLADFADSTDCAFVAVMSSMSSILGGIGHTSYAAANAYQDAFCYQHSKRRQKWISMNWDAWGEQQRVDGVSVSENSLTIAQATAAFKYGLDNFTGHQLVVSRQPLGERLANWVSGDIQQSMVAGSTGDAVARQDQDKLATLKQIWGFLLGHQDELGPQSDFFSHGGDSLVAIQMLSMIRSQLGVTFSLAEFINQPTFGVLSAVVLNEQKGGQKDSQKNGLNSADEGRNLVVLQPGDNSQSDAQVIVCVHPGGGSLTCYNNLLAQLDNSHQVLGLQSNLAAASDIPLHHSIEQMAGVYFEQLQSRLGNARVTVLCYCFGSLIGYELTRLIERDGNNPVERLILINGHAPTVDDGYFDFEYFLSKLAQRAQISLDQSQLAELATQDADAIARYLTDCIEQAGDARNEDQLNSFKRGIEEVVLSARARKHYQPAFKLSTETVLYRNDDVTFHVNNNDLRHLGWGDYLSNLQVEYVQGKHDDLFSVQTNLNTFVSCLEANQD